MCYLFLWLLNLYVIIIWLNLTLSWYQKHMFYLKNTKIQNTDANLTTIDLNFYLRTFGRYIFGWFFWIKLSPLRTRYASFRHVPVLKSTVRNIDMFENRRKCIPCFTAGALQSHVSREMITWIKNKELWSKSNTEIHEKFLKKNKFIHSMKNCR